MERPERMRERILPERGRSGNASLRLYVGFHLRDETAWGILLGQNVLNADNPILKHITVYVV